MKKALAVLMLAAMMLSTGCGNTMNGAKKDAQEAAQAVEQKVDAAKDAANQAADNATAKVEEVADDLSSAFEGRTVALSGIVPGSSIEDVEAMFGEATEVEGNVMTFIDGLKVTVDEAKQIVKSVSTTSEEFDTPDGIYVGADEYSLNGYCGAADTIRQIPDGAEYEYNSGDKKSKVVYTAQNGIITEITCSLK